MTGKNQAEERTEQARYLEMVSELRANRPARVTVKLFKDNNRYRDDLFVSVNGRSFQIPRGVSCEVPYEIAMCIEESARQDERTAELLTRMESESKIL